MGVRVSSGFKTVFTWARENWPKVYFARALLLLIFGYGVTVGKYRIFPYAVLSDAKVAAIELSKWLELYKPAVKEEDHPHVILWSSSASKEKKLYPESNDLTLVVGYRPGGFAIFLVDSNGREHHVWRLTEAVMQRVMKEDEWAMEPDHYEVMGVHLTSNGDLTFNISYKALIKIDRCSRSIWYLGENNHHSVDVDRNGFLWTPGRQRFDTVRADRPHFQTPYDEDFILKISPAGKLVEKISLVDAAFRGGFYGLILQGDHDYPEMDTDDPTHLNEVEVVSAAFAAKHDFANAGDILVSMRTIDAIAIIDKETHKMKYALAGMVLRQHDPDLRDNGNILLFDNRTSKSQHNEARYLTERQDFGYSRIIEIDPRTQKTVWSFEGSEENPFYTSVQGELQELENGNILVAEAEGGRVFEVDRKTRKIVWQYRNIIGKTDGGLLLGRVTGASRVHKKDLGFLGQACQ